LAMTILTILKRKWKDLRLRESVHQRNRAIKNLSYRTLLWYQRKDLADPRKSKLQKSSEPRKSGS
jgi:hypothetical protein